MTLFAAALLEKQIVIVCSNLVWFQALQSIDNPFTSALLFLFYTFWLENDASSENDVNIVCALNTTSKFQPNVNVFHLIPAYAFESWHLHLLQIFIDQGMLSASVLSIVPLIRPYQWQSLLMPVLPFCALSQIWPSWWVYNYCWSYIVLYDFQVLPIDMMDFLDAPVPYIVSSRACEKILLLFWPK